MTDTGERRVVVTGASSGIGRATARLFRDAGWAVTATARKDADLTALAADGFTPLRFELGDAASVRAAADAVLAQGAPEVLVNNAGFGLVKPLVETTREDWQGLLDANVTGHFDLTRRLLPAMRDAGGGRVVFVGSTAGRDGIPLLGAYAAAKAAQAAATDALRVEARPWNVRVSLVEPGPVKTRFADTALAPAAAAEGTRDPVYARAFARLAKWDRLVHQGTTAEHAARVIHRTATRRFPPARVPVGAFARLAHLRVLVPGGVRRGLYGVVLGLGRGGRKHS